MASSLFNRALSALRAIAGRRSAKSATAPTLPPATTIASSAGRSSTSANVSPTWRQIWESRRRGQTGQTTGPTARTFPRTAEVDLGGANRRLQIPKSDPVWTGEMIPVSSSNVHSIGFRLDANDSSDDLLPSTGTLLIRFLGTNSGGKRSGEGPLYQYHGVPLALFQQFRSATSKGRFVWDAIRIRGTVSGHRFSYELALLQPGTGYVPRQAGLKRGQQGEWFLTRRFEDAAGNVFTSRLPEQQVTMSGPNRGTPSRGTPNRGQPFRGR